MAGAAEGEVFVGDAAKELRGLLKLNYPTKHGITTDWEDMHVSAPQRNTQQRRSDKQRSRLLTVRGVSC